MNFIKNLFFFSELDKHQRHKLSSRSKKRQVTQNKKNRHAPQKKEGIKNKGKK
jgi:hypothetical protein